MGILGVMHSTMPSHSRNASATGLRQIWELLLPYDLWSRFDFSPGFQSHLQLVLSFVSRFGSYFWL